MNHVNPKSVLSLGVIAALAIAVATAIQVGRKPASEGAQVAQPLLPELREHINDVSAVTLTGGGDKPIATLEKGAAGWSVKEKGGYRADAGKLREFLLKLADASLLEPKTQSDKRYAELGVEDVKAADAKGVLVGLAGLAKPTQVILGHYNARSAGTFVRRAGEAQSWLAKGNLSADANVANWLDKALADIPATRLREVVLTAPDGKVVRAYKDQEGDANFKVADVPKGRELSSEYAANGLGTALAGLRFDDVFRARDAAPPADGKVNRAHFAAFDGLVVDATAWKKDEKVYARFAVSLDEKAAQARLVADQAKARADWETEEKARAAKEAQTSQTSAGKDAAKKEGAAPAGDAKPATMPVAPLAVSDPAKDTQQRLEELNREVSELQQRFEGWTYVLPNYRFESLAKRMDELLKPLDSGKGDQGKVALPPPSSVLDALPKH